MVGPRPWALWLFRVVVSVEAVLAMGQAVLAGGFLAGHYGMLDLHAANAAATAVTAVVLTVVAVVMWRPGGGAGWPAVACGALFAVEGVQMGLGYGRVLLVHVPLGVSIIVCITLLLVWAWRTPPGGGKNQRDLDRDLRDAVAMLEFSQEKSA
jgi:hypothetical protein